MSGKLSYKHTIFACYAGYITQAIVNNLSPLLFVIFRDTFNLPLSEITLLITINFLIQLCVDCLSAVFVDKIGYRKCIVAAHVFAVAGLASLAILPFIMPPFAGLLVSVFLYAVGGGLIEVLISPIVEACPTDNKASVMSLLHSFYCWGTVAVILLSTLFLTLAGRENWRILALLWAVFPLVNAVFFTKVPIAPLTEGRRRHENSRAVQERTFLDICRAHGSGGCERTGNESVGFRFCRTRSRSIKNCRRPCGTLYVLHPHGSFKSILRKSV